MQKTQIHFKAIRQNKIKKQKKQSLNKFIANMQPIKSFCNIEATEYVNNLRNINRLIN